MPDMKKVEVPFIATASVQRKVRIEVPDDATESDIRKLAIKKLEQDEDPSNMGESWKVNYVDLNTCVLDAAKPAKFVSDAETLNSLDSDSFIPPDI